MYRLKPGVFMADWFDENGKRHRKRFDSTIEAHRHEHFQQALAAAARCSAELDKAVHHTHRRHMERDMMAKQAIARVKESKGIQRVS